TLDDNISRDQESDPNEGYTLPQATEKPEETSSSNEDLPKDWKYVKSHPKELIIGDTSKGVTTRNSLRNVCNYSAFLSQIEPKTIDDAIIDKYRIMAMQEELN
ncbi:hypothetical protein, partial [Streptococcus uberis]|uniref:hypothetical protein n=1 Tax=Streptococcus uberis TaxID=1349 RepID=UPI003D6B9E9C